MNQKPKPRVGLAHEAVPRLPHERDELAEDKSAEPSKVMRQAAADIERGLKDTDRGPAMNQAAKRLKRRPWQRAKAGA